MQAIALQAVPDQVLSVVLAKQNCQIHVFQKNDHLYIDLTAGGKVITLTRMVRNGVPVLRGRYQGFAGDLMFMDMQGTNDPEYTELGSRYRFVYVEAYEI